MVMGPTIEFEVFGEKAISRRLLRFSERTVDAKPIFDKIAKMFYESEKKQFDSEGRWASGGWEQLTDQTIQEKMRHSDWSQSILQRTGRLMDSLIGESSDGKKDIKPDSMTITSDVPYGVYHQQADGSGTGKLPMRKPVELTDQTKMEIVKLMQAWVVGAKSIESLLE